MLFLCGGDPCPVLKTGDCELVSRAFSKFSCVNCARSGCWALLVHLLGPSWCMDLRRMIACVYGLRIEPRGAEPGIGLPFPLDLSSALSLGVVDACIEPLYRDVGRLSTDLSKVSLCLISYWATVGRGLLVLRYDQFWSNLEPPSEISPR